MLRIDDFVMLGKTVPEPNSDGRTFVCSAGWSDTLRSLIRIYPLSMHEAPAKWTVSEISLERNPKDSRFESFKIHGDRSVDAHTAINRAFSVKGKLTQGEKEKLMGRLPRISKADANSEKLSLAVCQPDHPPVLYYGENPESDDHPQLSLFDDRLPKKQGAKRFPYQPRLRFSSDGHHHDLQIREWGVYEWLRREGFAKKESHPIKAELKKNPPLLLGNLCSHRNTWLVIDRLAPQRQQDLFAAE